MKRVAHFRANPQERLPGWCKLRRKFFRVAGGLLWSRLQQRAVFLGRRLPVPQTQTVSRWHGPCSRPPDWNRARAAGAPQKQQRSAGGVGVVPISDVFVRRAHPHGGRAFTNGNI